MTGKPDVGRVVDRREACAPAAWESLEPRRLLSGAVNVSDDVLVIKGTRLADTIVLAMDGEKGLEVRLNGSVTKVARRKFDTIRIVTGRGNDQIYANDGGWSHPMKRPMVMHLGPGNDSADTNYSNCTVWGEDGNDTIISHDGRDVIRGGLGDDYIEGRYGNDTLYGEGGNDHVRGGGDDDFVSGGRGNDTLRDGWGKDTVWGGMGGDRFLYSDTSGDKWADRVDGESYAVDWDFSAVEGSMGMTSFNSAGDLMIRFGSGYGDFLLGHDFRVVDAEAV
jgi:Ca2+-binding RTX toxin-like protein